ncbi:hypothetical protein [Acidovorax delafieldii]|uniref:hypothetical protein n=1 Tax=Acidovorax delafieldii TaxID=47920 RepID=UPI003ED0E021
MELNEKQLLALAAIGAAFWYFTRKSPATAAQAAVTPAAQPAPAGGGIWDGFGVGGSLAQAMGQVAATAQPLPTPASNNTQVVTNTKAPVQVAAPSATPVFGPSGGGSVPINGMLMDGNGNWIPADQDKVKPYAGYTFGSSPNTGQTDGQRAMSILGY